MKDEAIAAGVHAQANLERKELANLVGKLQGGKVISESERHRMNFLLAKYVSTSPEDQLAEKAFLGEPQAVPSKISKYANPVQQAARIRVVAVLLRDGYGSGEIVRKCTAKWGVKDRCVEGHIAKARRAIEERSAASMHFLRGRQEERLSKLYRESQVTGDTRALLAALEQTASLHGLNATAKQEIIMSGPDGGPIQTAEVELPDNGREVKVKVCTERP